MRFTRVCLVLLFIHYAVEAVYHTCRILSYLEKSSLAQKIFKLGDMMFVLGRLGSVILAVLTFWYGLAKMPLEQQVLDLATGNFNTGLIRLNCLIAVCALQAFLMYKFIIFQVQRRREMKSSGGTSAAAAAKARKSQQERAKARKEKRENKEDEDDRPEVDQDSKVRQRVKQTARWTYRGTCQRFQNQPLYHHSIIIIVYVPSKVNLLDNYTSLSRLPSIEQTLTW